MANTAPTFFTGGKVITDLGGGAAAGRDVVIAPDGKIVGAGSRANLIMFVRYNADGTPDTSFGPGGEHLGPTPGFGWDAVIQPDGAVLFAADSSGVVRLNTDGTMGVIGGGRSTAVALQADGKIVTAGFEVLGANLTAFRVQRLNADGTPDTTFDGDGYTTTKLGPSIDQGQGITVQPDGRIVVVGYSGDVMDDQFAIVRYNANGSLDTTFGGGDGIALINAGPFYDHLDDVVVQPDGKIVASGFHRFGGFDDEFAVFRFNPDGSLDSTFAGDGSVIGTYGGVHARADRILLQPDGKILIAGVSDYDNFGMARFNANGTPDTSFGGGDGAVITDFGAIDWNYGMALQPDGRIVLFGDTVDGSAFKLALARYNADGSLDLTFGPAVNTLGGTVVFNEGSAPVVLDADVRVFDTELAAQGHYAGATLTLARHGGANAQDVFSATGSLGPLTPGGPLVYAGIAIGTVNVNSAGTLLLTFNANATPVRLEAALQSLAYANTSTTPPDTVQIDWSFSDGNSGAQGAGGALATSGSTTVAIIDVATGTGGPDVLVGDGGSNVLQGLGGDDLLYGLAGNDILRGEFGNDRLEGGAGGDSLNGWAGFDYASYTNAAAAVRVELWFPALSEGDAAGDEFLSIEGVIGSRFGDRIGGDREANDLAGFDGDDEIDGKEGNDGLQGGNGNDTLVGGQGADRLDGGAGFDYASYSYLFGPPAGQGVVVNLSTHGTAGEAAGDIYVSIEGVIGTPLSDTLIGNGAANELRGMYGNDTLDGGAGDDTLRGGEGDDTLIGGPGADRLNGAGDSPFGGLDTASYVTAASGIVVNLGDTTASTGDAAGDTYTAIWKIVGSRFNDTMVGLDSPVRQFFGGDGDDYLQVARTSLSGMLLSGDDGNDRLEGGVAGDTLDGGAGYDYASYLYSPYAVTVSLSAGAGFVNEDTFVSIEGLIGSSAADVLRGDDSSNDLAGMAGNDELQGRGGNDVLQGGEGNDTLAGGEGADRLIGGAGEDMFVLARGLANGDVLVDFAGNGAAAGDTIALTGYGSAAAGATFVQLSATRWQINSADGLVHDTITIANGAPIHATDYTFV